MGFRVQGVLDGALYEVEVTGDAKAPVAGSARVRALVRHYDGQQVRPVPTGPTYTVSASDPASLLALLGAHTRVLNVGDGAPDLAGRYRPAAVS